MGVKIKILIFFILFLFIGFFLYYFAHFYIYSLFIEDLKNNEKYLYLKQKKISESSIEDLEEKSIWKSVHFSNVIIPFPVKHPLYRFIPLIKEENFGVSLGLTLTDPEFREKNIIRFLGPRKFDYVFKEKLIYRLPIFQNYIFKKGKKQIFKDLFLMNLNDILKGKSFWETLKTFEIYSFKELVYRSYILINRKIYLNKPFESIGMNEDQTYGILEGIKDELFLSDYVYIFEDGILYELLLETNRYDQRAIFFRQKFLNEIRFKLSSKDIAKKLYDEFRKLDFDLKSDQLGLLLQMASWSHDLERSAFLAQIIKTLERGNCKFHYVSPLYDYAFKKYGDNFSNLMKFKEETNMNRLERKMREQLLKEKREEENRVDYIIDGKFQNAEEKIKYHLDRSEEQRKLRGDPDHENAIYLD